MQKIFYFNKRYETIKNSKNLEFNYEDDNINDSNSFKLIENFHNNKKDKIQDNLEENTL